MRKSKKLKEVPDRYAMFGQNIKKPKATGGYKMFGQNIKTIAKASKKNQRSWTY